MPRGTPHLYVSNHVPMILDVTVLPGDGIGPEVTEEAVAVLKAVAEAGGHELRLCEHLFGSCALDETGTGFPDETREACRDTGAILLGAVGNPAHDHLPPRDRPEAALLELRRFLSCFANLRPVVASGSVAVSSPFRKEVLEGVDLLIVRELTGGLYFGEPRGVEGEGSQRRAFDTLSYRADEIERIARVAFDAASGRRRRVTSIDKANVLESSKLWREVVRDVARDYSDIELDHMYVDRAAMEIVSNPSQFDVIVTGNLFGDILSDEASVLAGSLGLLPSASIGGSIGLFEPVHGSAPDIAGKGVANPMGAIASAAMMLRHAFSLEDEAQAIDRAVHSALSQGVVTADLAGEGAARSTREVGEFVAEQIASGA